MGESAVLFHSYSFAAPLPRYEDNTIYALSQSVSFGRFMTENLEWGKWSSFSHKKYVDEAEKSSRPGSVAQKKAFFEAYYNAKKPKASNESSDPESVVALLNTLDILTKDEDKYSDEESERISFEDLEIVNEVLLRIEEDDEDPERESFEILEPEDDFVVVEDEEFERKSVAVLEQEDDLVVVDEEPERKSFEIFEQEDDLVIVDEETERKSVAVLEKEDDLVVVEDEEPERKCVAVLEQEDDLVMDEPVVSDDMEVVFDEMEEKENETEDEEFFVGEQEEERRSVIAKNSAKIAPLQTPDFSSEKTSERPVMSKKKIEKPVRQRFGFFNCLVRKVKTQHQNTTNKKAKTDKKQNKLFICLCFKP